MKLFHAIEYLSWQTSASLFPISAPVGAKDEAALRIPPRAKTSFLCYYIVISDPGLYFPLLIKPING